MKTKDATTRTTTRTDTEDGFTRTAIVCDAGDGPSVDLVTSSGVRLAQVNISFTLDDEGNEVLIVDVIDVDKRYQRRRALAFSPKVRREMKVPRGGTLVSVDFRAGNGK